MPGEDVRARVDLWRGKKHAGGENGAGLEILYHGRLDLRMGEGGEIPRQRGAKGVERRELGGACAFPHMLTFKSSATGGWTCGGRKRANKKEAKNASLGWKERREEATGVCECPHTLCLAFSLSMKVSGSVSDRKLNAPSRAQPHTHLGLGLEHQPLQAQRELAGAAAVIPKRVDADGRREDVQALCDHHNMVALYALPIRGVVGERLGRDDGKAVAAPAVYLYIC